MLRKLYDIIIKLMQNVKIIYFSIKGLSQTMFEITPNKIINNYVSDISIVNGCIFRYAKNLHRQAWLLTYLLCAFNFLIFIFLPQNYFLIKLYKKNSSLSNTFRRFLLK